jgi:hypothetical protein
MPEEEENWPKKKKKSREPFTIERQPEQAPTKMDIMLIAKHRIMNVYASEEEKKKQKEVLNKIEEHSYVIANNIIKRAVKENNPNLIESVSKKFNIGIKQIPSEGISVDDLSEMRKYDKEHKEVFYSIIPKTIEDQEEMKKLRKERADYQKAQLEKRVEQAKERMKKQKSLDNFK